MRTLPVTVLGLCKDGNTVWMQAVGLRLGKECVNHIHVSTAQLKFVHLEGTLSAVGGARGDFRDMQL